MEEKILYLHKKGYKQKEIAHLLKIEKRKVHYIINRKKIISRQIEYFKNLPIEKKKEVYRKRLPYLKRYMKKRYHEDEEFRKKVLERNRKKKDGI